MYYFECLSCHYRRDHSIVAILLSNISTTRRRKCRNDVPVSYKTSVAPRTPLRPLHHGLQQAALARLSLSTSASWFLAPLAADGVVLTARLAALIYRFSVKLSAPASSAPLARALSLTLSSLSTAPTRLPPPPLLLDRRIRVACSASLSDSPIRGSTRTKCPARNGRAPMGKSSSTHHASIGPPMSRPPLPMFSSNHFSISFALPSQPPGAWSCPVIPTNAVS